MRKDHQPYWIKYLLWRLDRWYINRFVRPHFDELGQSPMIIRPKSCEIHGANICAGDFLHLISHPLKPIRFTTWSSKSQQGQIQIGNYCLISPGVEITSAANIHIGDNCMIGAECVIHDSDWHGLYNRLRPFRCTHPVQIHNNVWIGMRSIICKGVSIGENSVIGAGSVVTRDIPSNSVAAGNPARVVKTLNPNRRWLKREFLFSHQDYWQHQDKITQFMTAENRFPHWLRTQWKPTQKD